MRTSILLLAILALTMSDGAHAAPAARRQLRVCADPDGLPYSNDRGEGFENAIATLLARDLGADVSYTWWASRRGFFRNTINGGACDVVIGVPLGTGPVATTRAYYRSTFAFVSKAARELDVRSLDDRRLRALRIGVPLVGDDYANPPPAHALARRGMVDNVEGYPVYADYGQETPALVDALARGTIDVAIVWGPIAAYYARRAPVPLRVTQVAEATDDGAPLAFDIAVGVQRKDDALLRALDVALVHQKKAIDGVLRRHGITSVEQP